MAKRIFLLSMLLLVNHALFSQRSETHKKLSSSEQETVDTQINYRCTRTNKYNTKQRRGFFPFSAAVVVKLISFEAPMPIKPAIFDKKHQLISGDTGRLDTIPLFTPIAPGNFYLNRGKVKETKLLTEIQIDSLTDILYNVGYTPVKNLAAHLVKEMSCYEPRNAILFYDANNRLTGYIELCFDCWRHYYSSSKMKEVEYCEQKYDMLKNFFLVSGIKYVERPQVADNED